MGKTEKQKGILSAVCIAVYMIGVALLLLGGVVAAPYSLVGEFHPMGTLIFLCGLVFLLCGSILFHAYIIKFWREKE